MESLKELVVLIEKLPGTALWILGGFLVYKLFIAGSIVGAITMISKLLINRIHEIQMKPKETIVKHDLGRNFICRDGTYDRFLDIVGQIRGVRTSSKVSEYIHSADVAWLSQAVQEKKARDKREEQPEDGK